MDLNCPATRFQIFLYEILDRGKQIIYYKDGLLQRDIRGEIMDDFCFVAQPFDDGKYDSRYRDIIKPAVESCGFRSYRVDEDNSAEIPISTVEAKIKEASFVIAEISTDNPNVWFEVGFALASSKSVILMCSDERTSGFPFDIRHRNILTYHTESLSDFKECRKNLKEMILARYVGLSVSSEPHVLTDEELFVLKFVSRDQKTSFAITAEEKIMKNSLDRDTISDCLKSLIKNGYLEYRYSTTGGESYYQITKKSEIIFLTN